MIENIEDLREFMEDPEQRHPPKAEDEDDRRIRNKKEYPEIDSDT